MQKNSPTFIKTASSALETAQPSAIDAECQALHGAFPPNEHGWKTAAASDSPIYWAERWELVRHLPVLHDTALLLAQIGSRL